MKVEGGLVWGGSDGDGDERSDSGWIIKVKPKDELTDQMWGVWQKERNHGLFQGLHLPGVSIP